MHRDGHAGLQLALRAVAVVAARILGGLAAMAALVNHVFGPRLAMHRARHSALETSAPIARLHALRCHHVHCAVNELHMQAEALHTWPAHEPREVARLHTLRKRRHQARYDASHVLNKLRLDRSSNISF